MMGICAVIFCGRSARGRRWLYWFTVRDQYCQLHHDREQAQAIPADHPDAFAAHKLWDEEAEALMARARTSAAC